LLTETAESKRYPPPVAVDQEIRGLMLPRSSLAWLCPAACLAVLALAGCSSDALKPNPTPPNYQGLGSGSAGDPSVNRMGGEDSGVIFGIDKSGINRPGSSGGGAGPGTGIGVNAFLWRGALDTISFMPLASADPFGGVIITDWYTPPGTSGERFKATVYILSRDLRADGVKANIYRQVLDSRGQWVDAPVQASTVTEIENKILARARTMREQMAAS
jgi:hypothetical protein